MALVIIDGIEKAAQITSQYPGDFFQRIDAWIFITPLDPAQIGAVNASIERELLLRNIPTDPNAPDILANKFAPAHGHDKHYPPDIKPLDISIILTIKSYRRTS